MPLPATNSVSYSLWHVGHGIAGGEKFLSFFRLGVGACRWRCPKDESNNPCPWNWDGTGSVGIRSIFAENHRNIYLRHGNTDAAIVERMIFYFFFGGLLALGKPATALRLLDDLDPDSRPKQRIFLDSNQSRAAQSPINPSSLTHRASNKHPIAPNCIQYTRSHPTRPPSSTFFPFPLPLLFPREISSITRTSSRKRKKKVNTILLDALHLLCWQMLHTRLDDARNDEKEKKKKKKWELHPLPISDMFYDTTRGSDWETTDWTWLIRFVFGFT